jgi:hypothetical protein
MNFLVCSAQLWALWARQPHSGAFRVGVSVVEEPSIVELELSPLWFLEGVDS